ATRATAHPPEVKAEKAEPFPFLQIHSSTFLFIHFHFELRKFLPQSFLHGRSQPTLFRVGAHQYHQIIGESSILDHRESAVARHFPRPLQHLVHLIEIEITEQRRSHAPYTKGNFQFERIITGWRTRYALPDLRLKK